jgi:hypothetical protein
MTVAPLPGRTSLAGLSGGARMTVALSVAALAAVALDLLAVASVASLTALTLPIFRLARRQFASDSIVTPVLASFTLFWLVMLATIEVLSVFSLLGSPIAWTLLLVLLALALQIAERSQPERVPPCDRLAVPPLMRSLTEPWGLVVGPAAMVLGLLFVQSIYLNTLTGINHTDGQWYYMARSIRYLQDGNVSTYSTVNDFQPHFHQTTSAYLLLFYRSDAVILLLSTLFGAFACLTLFDLARLTGAPVSLAVLAGLSPISVPIVSLHLGTSNFDLHTALFLLLTMHGIILAIRTSQRRYLIIAAAATSLGIATKVTFWFAIPGLAILWIATVVILARQYQIRALARTLALATLIVMVGCIHPARTVLTQDLSRELNEEAHGRSSSSSVSDRLQVTVFNVLASTTTLMTPEILVQGRSVTLVEDAFRRVNERLGIRLPNEKIFYYEDRSWRDVFDHLKMPFHSDKAGFGAIIPLAVFPAALVIVFDIVRKRSVFSFHAYLLIFGALYLVTLGAALKYASDHVRYLIEMVLPLLLLVPVGIARLPRRIGMVYLAVIAGFMLADAYRSYRLNEQRPPDRVAIVPRQEQYQTFVSPERSSYYEAARQLNLKYPTEERPEIFLFKEGWFVPVRFEYPFMDVAGRRRLTYWLGDLDRDRPDWPGPFLVVNPAIADLLRSRFADQVVLDRLADSVWLGLPRDQLRVLWRVDWPNDRESSIVLEANVEPGRYLQPEYRFETFDVRDGRPMETLRDFSSDPRLTLPSSSVARILEIRVSVRESGSYEAAERVAIPERRMLER